MQTSLISNIFKNRIELIFILVLIFVSAFLRFPQLGYSHFYGDETKTLFTRKDVSATDFLLDKRKGPVQFLVSWVSEKTFGGFNEATIRLPYAIAGFLSVLVFYLIVRNLFNYQIAFLSAFLFSTNGFFVAFSRTAQYQSFLILFGFLSVLFALFYMQEFFKNLAQQSSTLKIQNIYLFFSGIFLALAYLSHYDALFYDIVVGIIFLRVYFFDKFNTENSVFYLNQVKNLTANDKVLNVKNKIIKQIVVYCILPFLVIVGAFYVPYLISGYFSENTLGYINKRVTGQEYKINNSIYTFNVYNPAYLALSILIFSFLAFAKKFNFNKTLVFVWFLAPFILFEIIFSNPGTHILNYIIPLFIFTGIGIYNVYILLKNNVVLSKLFTAFIFTIFTALFYISSFTFIPALSNGYPFERASYFGIDVPPINNDYHLFLYGFPYYRAWDQAAEYMLQDNVRSFYTNDNATIGEFYLNGAPIHYITENTYPHYYVHIYKNQEFNYAQPNFPQNNFELKQTFEYKNEVVAEVYKRIKGEND